ncbi:fused MFS/spermidine synthase [Arthrobacter roseus]|uniref:spermidine synthase n=1 Tax=Arthrobacter roseus TaxID=136274 RepID=UPI0030843F71|nr:spermidine synthase [Arthrobacter roseus]
MSGHAGGPGGAVPSRFLKSLGAHAVIDPDALVDGAYILSMGDAQQSHVNLASPDEVFYEYLRRIAHVVDLVAPAEAPIDVLHLGAGALTLARYVQATRPGSVQHVVELERELLDFVLAHLPLPPGTDLTVRIGDARSEADGFAAGTFDVVVLDIFAGADAPAHLACAEYYGELLRLLSPGGVLLVNVGDDPPLDFARRQAHLLLETAGDVAVMADASVFSGRYPGNLVFAAVNDRWRHDWTAALLERGPHPAAVRTGVDAAVFGH